MEIIPTSDIEDDAHEATVTVAQTGDVRIVDNFKFERIDDARLTSFVEWWPIVAKTVIAGIYSDQDAQRAAVRALMPLFDRFKHNTIAQMRMLSPEAQNMQEMLSSRLMFEEQYILSVKDAWQDSITMLEDRCRRLFKNNKSAEDSIDAKAKELERKYAPSIGAQRARSAIDKIKTMYKQRQRRISAAELKLLRSEVLQVPQVKRPETKQLDERIESLYRGVSSGGGSVESIRRIRETYDTHILNIEYEMARQVRDECKSKWLRGLRPAA